MKLYFDHQLDPTPLNDKSVHVLGYGSQGRAHALNLRDSGVDVRVAARSGPTARQAEQDGLEVVPLEQAAEADVLAFLLPDLAQPEVYLEHVQPHLNRQTLLFAHGFNVWYETIEPPETCDVVMVAPKAPGRKVRETFEEGFGVPCLAAVHQDASGHAWPTALAYARALGGGRAGVLCTTFQEETETDLFGEQAVLCGGVTELVVAGFETLVSAGYQAEVAYFECMHELKLIVDLLYEGGLARMHRFVSDTAKFGDLTRGPRVVTEQTRAAMSQILTEIQDGTFAREWIGEVKSGMPRYRQLMSADLEHPIEDVGRKLRQLMDRTPMDRTDAGRANAKEGINA